MNIFNILTKFINRSLNQEETRVLEQIKKGNGNNSRLFSIVIDYFSYKAVDLSAADKERVFEKIKLILVTFHTQTTNPSLKSV